MSDCRVQHTINPSDDDPSHFISKLTFPGFPGVPRIGRCPPRRLLPLTLGAEPKILNRCTRSETCAAFQSSETGSLPFPEDHGCTAHRNRRCHRYPSGPVETKPKFLHECSRT